MKTTRYQDQYDSILSELQCTSCQGQHSLASSPAESIEDRAHQRVQNEETFRQQNLEDIILGAVTLLEHEQFNTESSRIEEDWLRQFKNCSQDISNTEMKLIWSKVLAGEIKRPKSYSVRTLHLLGELSKDDAEIIAKIAPFTLCGNSGMMAVIHDEWYDNDIVKLDDILFLSELGILQASTALSISFDFDNEAHDYSNVVTLRNGDIGVNIFTNLKMLSIPAYTVTLIGTQIFSLIEDVVPNVEYFRKTLERVLFGCKCVCGRVSGFDEENGFVFEQELFSVENIKKRD